MDKINFKEKLKDKKVYIPLIIIGILALILILFLVGNVVSSITASKDKKYVSSAQEVSFKDELGEDSNRKTVTVKATKANDKCVDSICVTNVSILCYDDRGVIEFTVKNDSSSTSKGFLRLEIINDSGSVYSAVIWYDSVEPGKTVDGFHSYFGDYNLKNYSKYKVAELSDEDITSLSKFKYTEDKNGKREYYEIGYTDEGYYEDEE